ncbi:MAG: YczE/YyaS/YitT family protein [Actinomycetales bacterium]
MPAALGPVAQLRAGRLPVRVCQLLIGLAIYGVSIGLMIRSGLGNAPWDVLHQGLAQRLPLTVGTAIIVVSALVLLLWVPLRQPPGLGTLLNAVLVGVAAEATLNVLDVPDGIGWRAMFLGLGVVGNALATALYIGAQLGPGPRDGLMTGLHRRTGLSVRLVRTAIELVVVGVGWLLGGTLGVGTVVYALAIGPLVQVLMPWCTIQVRDPTDIERPERKGPLDTTTH